MTPEAGIDIIMGTYNGEAFLREQIESLLAQTVTDWRLLIRDDGSKDGTVAIIREYVEHYPGRIMQMDADGGNLGVVANFGRLMEASEAPYVMFCDQDDRWYPDKIAVTREAMNALEEKHGRDKPLMVHTDARLVDVNMQPTHDSFHRALSHDMTDITLEHELVQNTAHGCTMMMNRALVTCALPFPSEARMHDMWVHLLVLSLGYSAYLDVATLDYRQHGKNVIGALPQTNVGQAKRKARKTIEASALQAVMVLDRIETGSEPGAEQAMARFVAATRAGWFSGTLELLADYCPAPRLKNAVRILLR